MQKIAERLISRLAWLYLNLVGKTSKIYWLNTDKLRKVQAQYGNVLYALWHGRQFFFPFAYRNQPASVIVSESKDGNYIARTMDLFGLKAIRGSSSRGGARALIALKREIQAGQTVGITPDGPKGPQRKVAGGILLLSAKSGRPILPITYSSKYKLIFRGWDEYWIPLPFNRILINYGNPITLENEDTLNAKASHLEQELNRITLEADEICKTGNFPSPAESRDPLIRPAQESISIKVFYLFYTLLFILSSPFILFSFLLKYKGFLFKNIFLGMGERLGRLHPFLPSKLRNPIWIHAASLGETRAAAPLTIALRKKVPFTSFVFSASTVTGLIEAKKLQLADFYFYSPLDIPWVLKKVFKKIRPRLLLLLESELWPNWLRTAKLHHCKVVIVNGRMSEKSSRRYLQLGQWSKIIMDKIDSVCAREETDAKRFEQAGVPKEKIKITGNLKFDWLPWQGNSPLQKGHLQTGYLIFTAGSIRQGEEKFILEAYLKLKNKHASLKLILAPRHLETIPKIEKLLRTKGISFALKSHLTLNSDTESHDFVGDEVSATMDYGLGTMDCLLWDTFGDLWQAYQSSTIVFVGGSLVQKGGQNPIEPAWFGKPVLFGPHMENFAEPAKLLLENRGALQVKDSAELALRIDELLSELEKLKQFGENAKKSVERFAGHATQKTLDLLSSYVQI